VSYLHILEYTECVAQIMGIDIHETVENINIWDDLPIDQVLQQDSFVNFISLPANKLLKCCKTSDKCMFKAIKKLNWRVISTKMTSNYEFARLEKCYLLYL